MNLYDYINKRNSLKSLTNEEFDELLPQLVKLLINNGFIYDNYQSDVLVKDWNSLCKKDTLNEPINKIFAISATNTIGMKIIKHYMPHFYNVKNYKGISVLSLWKNDKLEKALRFNRKYHSTPYVSEIIRSLSFTCGLGKVTIYRPLIAKNVVSYFNAKRVLDVCVGWGGRMLGVKSLGNDMHYTGIEPCLPTYEGLCNIQNTLQLSNVTLINEPAEIALNNMCKDTKFDLALTSPPYYNLEIYSDEDSQSLNYGSYENWVKKFLEPVICNVITRVKYSCWSIKNFKTDQEYNLLDDVIQIHKKHGWEKLDIYFSMTNSKRPGNNNDSTTMKLAEETTYTFVESSPVNTEILS
jgi:hypothetical protein